MNKRTKFVIGLLIFIIIGCSTYYYFQDSKINDYFENKEVISNVEQIIDDQEVINRELNSYLENPKFTFDDPKIIYNPYNISPLTAIVLFQTEEETDIKVIINNKEITTIASSKKHSIPLYGLLSDYNNEITLINNKGEEKSLTITTDYYENKYPLNVITTSEELNDDLYFTSAPSETGLSAYDKDGNLRWYLTNKYCMDMEWLDNGHFLVGISPGSVGDRKIGFIEMDYLGKIYNYYISKYGYDFEFQTLSNGNVMLAGGNTPVNYTNSYIYELDLSTGDVVSYFDLSKTLLEIDPNFDKNMLGSKSIRNGFYYDETSDELIISLRGNNSLIDVQYKTGELNWILGSDEYYSDLFDEYRLNITNTLGQHSPFITKDGLIGVYNNYFDRVNHSDLTSDYIDTISAGELYSIDLDLNANLVWSSKNVVNKYFNHKYGYFRILDNGNKLLDYGWVMHENYLNGSNSLGAIENDLNNTYAAILELDENDNILFEATTEEGKYRVFKHSIYTTNNIDVSYFKYFNNEDTSEIKSIETSDLIPLLNDSISFDYDLNFTRNTLETNYQFESDDNITLVFLSKDYYSYEYSYKENTPMNIDLIEGEYALYIKINDVYYDTNKIINY